MRDVSRKGGGAGYPFLFSKEGPGGGGAQFPFLRVIAHVSLDKY